jgi:hypothetical protein
MRTFYSMRASEDENIPDYINKMKTLVDDINNTKTIFRINDITYAGVLTQSLPATWDTFINKLYLGVSNDKHSTQSSIVHFHRELKDEYYHRIGCKEDKALQMTQQSNLSVTKKTLLANRISGKKGPNLYCTNCKKDNHTTNKCRHLSKALYTICNRFGHKTSNCYNNENRDRNNKKKCYTRDNNKLGRDFDNRPSKKGKYKQSSQVAEADKEMSAVFIEENKIPSNYEEDEYGLIEPFGYNDNVNYAENNSMIRDCYIECLVDSKTTSHIFNKRALFTDYRPLNNVYVGGVGGTKTCTHGKGTIHVLAEMKSGKCTIKLNNVLHVPECKHNLISLGR